MNRLGILFILAFVQLFSSSKACVCEVDFTPLTSQEQLKEYSFIAHVTVVKEEMDWVRDRSEDSYIGAFARLTLKINELFKGDSITDIIEYDVGSSCDIGVEAGAEWIVFAHTDSTGTTFIWACDKNERHRGGKGETDWKHGSSFYLLDQLRKIYGHPIKSFEGKRIEYYANGTKEIEENYINGKKEGPRKIWYPNGNLMCEEFYEGDTVTGPSKWYFESGQLDEEYCYIGCHFSRRYYDTSLVWWHKNFLLKYYLTEDSLNGVYHRIQLEHENIYNAYSQLIISREYHREGGIYYEHFFEYTGDNRKVTTIYYHPNGKVSSIGHELNGKKYGHYQGYDKEGKPTHGWDYDEKGEKIEPPQKSK